MLGKDMLYNWCYSKNKFNDGLQYYYTFVINGKMYYLYINENDSTDNTCYLRDVGNGFFENNFNDISPLDIEINIPYEIKIEAIKKVINLDIG